MGEYREVVTAQLQQQVAAGVGVLKLVDGGERRQGREPAGFFLGCGDIEDAGAEPNSDGQVRADLGKFRFLVGERGGSSRQCRSIVGEDTQEPLDCLGVEVFVQVNGDEPGVRLGFCGDPLLVFTVESCRGVGEGNVGGFPPGDRHVRAGR